jgi:hypothetical protein
MDNEYQYLPLYSKNEEWITCTYDRYKLAQREGCGTRILTPAPLSEQKQEGETDNPYVLGTFDHMAWEQGAQWQSQHTAKELAEKEKRIKYLEDALQNIADSIDCIHEGNGDIKQEALDAITPFQPQ